MTSSTTATTPSTTLTDKNRWQTPETSVAATPDDPCNGVAGCGDLVPDSFITIDEPETNINVDTSKNFANGCQGGSTGASQPSTSFNALPAAERQMELFGGINGTFEYVGTDPGLLDKNGDQEQQVQVTFNATSATPVLAWGGHIASRLDWGCADGERSASAISGSPYHMRIKSALVNGTPVSLGNQDRSLSASAVIFIQSNLTTTPGGSVDYTADVTDSLNVGVPTAGGTADFYLYSSQADCLADTTRTSAIFSSLNVAVANGVTGTVTKTFDPGPADDDDVRLVRSLRRQYQSSSQLRETRSARSW